MSSKKNNINTKNKYFMNLALKQAARSLGNTGTNPPVGSVITDKKGNLISFGRTGSKGKPHAEFNAIKNSQKKLTNCNMFVTLEPCTHYAQTPPCTNLIIKNKIKKVYYSIDDVDIRTAKKGKKTLANAKVIVNAGINKKIVRKFYYFYYKNKIKKLPFVTCKLAISKDGFIKNIKNKNISNESSRKVSHILRSQNNAILISSNTLIDDNPLLTCRVNGLKKHSPTRIILDKNLDIPLNSKIVQTSNVCKTLVFYNKKKTKKLKILRNKGIKLYFTYLDNKNNFELNKIFKKIYQLKYPRLLVEGGKKLTNSIISKSLADEFYLFKSDNKLKNNGKINVNNILKKINTFSKNKRSILVNLDKEKLFNYNFY